MIALRPAEERGHTRLSWLDSRHSFSFDRYYDPRHMGFRVLRVINEDRVDPGQGFGTHPHRDMEILTFVLEGVLEHKDSLGSGSVIRPGDVQRMTAGTGISHSEFNPSRTEPVHFLQVWILPERPGLEPSYEQRSFPAAGLRLVGSRDGREGSVRIHQDVLVYVGRGRRRARPRAGPARLDPDGPRRRAGERHAARGGRRGGAERGAVGHAARRRRRGGVGLRPAVTGEAARAC